MVDVLNKLLPHVMEKPEELYLAFKDTLLMVAFSAVISLVISLALGLLLVVGKEDGLLPLPWARQLVDKSINFFRSVPFVILITLLLPITRAVAGTALGVRGAILPLVFGTVPFFSRQIEIALEEVNPGLIEAAQAMGESRGTIVFRVLLKEAIPGLIRGTTLTLISLIGLTAMAGVVGGGGLGDFAIRYGHQRRQFDCTAVVVLIILVLVTAIQITGDYLVKRLKHDS